MSTRRNANRARAGLAIGVFAAALVGCQDSALPNARDAASGPDAGPDASAAADAAPAIDANSGPTVIGPAGGTLVSPDHRLTVTIPAGALAAEHTFTLTAYVTNAPTPQVSLPGFRITPGGITLSRPATIRLTGVTTAGLSGINALSITAAGQPDDTRNWEFLSNLRTGDTWVEGETSHFSAPRESRTCRASSDCQAWQPCIDHECWLWCIQSEAGHCADRLDNDCDGYFDAYDPDCR